MHFTLFSFLIFCLIYLFKLKIYDNSHLRCKHSERTNQRRETINLEIFYRISIDASSICAAMGRQNKPPPCGHWRQRRGPDMEMERSDW